MKVVLLVLSLLAALAVAVFAEQNHRPLDMAFLVWHHSTTLPIVIFLAAFLGAICAGVLGAVSTLRWRHRARQLEQELAHRAAASPAPDPAPARESAPLEPQG